MTTLTMIREDHGLSVEQLAEAAEIEPAEVSRYEQGQGKPTRVHKLLLADALGVPTCALDPIDLGLDLDDIL